jgi:anti-anti-sigma regulatory factor
MKLEISEIKDGKESVELLLKGDLTIYSVKLLYEKLKSLINKFQKIEIDMDKVVKIDTAGYQVLISALKQEKIIFPGKCSDEVKKIFSFYGEKI